MGAITFFILMLAMLSLILSAISMSRDTPLSWRFTVPDQPKAKGMPTFTEVFNYDAPDRQAHAPAICVDDTGFTLHWFEGSAEAQADVTIRSTRFRQIETGWQATRPVTTLTPDTLGKALKPPQRVTTLGNVIQNEGMPEGLYVTIVSIGGWAMASVAEVQTKSGVTQARKLNLSPILNRSYLVKSPMVAYADGSQALPAYFEMGLTHGALIRFGPDGRVRDRRRMPSTGVKAIQPMVVALSDTQAVAFLRDLGQSGVLWVSRTQDSGQSWSQVQPTDIPNPSAPVAALRTGSGDILMALNGRADQMHLALSKDHGNSWRIIHKIKGEAGDLRYPMLRRVGCDNIALSFSQGSKRGIRAYVFNDAWVETQ